MQTFKCQRDCCTVKVQPYSTKTDSFERVRRRRRKAGVFIYDPKKKKVLLVQSRGHLWGPPKGTLEYGETERACAVREVKEETGLDVDPTDFSGVTNLANRAIYFYLEMDEQDVTVQDHIPDNDANGIGWIDTSCLHQCIENGNITLSKHCRVVFQRFLGLSFPYSTFIVVEKKKRSSRF